MKNKFTILIIFFFIGVVSISYMIKQPKIEASSWKYRNLIKGNVPERFKEYGQFYPFFEPSNIKDEDLIGKADMTSGVFWSRVVTFKDTRTLLDYYMFYEGVLPRIVQYANEKEYEYTIVYETKLGEKGFIYTGYVPAVAPIFNIWSLDSHGAVLRIDGVTLTEYYIVFYQCNTIAIIEASEPIMFEPMVMDYAYELDRKIKSQLCKSTQ